MPCPVLLAPWHCAFFFFFFFFCGALLVSLVLFGSSTWSSAAWVASHCFFGRGIVAVCEGLSLLTCPRMSTTTLFSFCDKGGL